MTMGKCKTKAIKIDLGIIRHNQAYAGIIQVYSGIFRTLCNPCIFRTVVHPEPGHIQDPSIFTSLVYSEPRYFQNAGIFRIRDIFRTMSDIYDKALYENS